MAKHGIPDDDMECACCYDDIMEENYVEYRTGEGMEIFWLDEQYDTESHGSNGFKSPKLNHVKDSASSAWMCALF